ncbi:MAG: hypothetical protein J0I10_17940 [Verrucomicrobia bacterium]|nr:hypothetical protein [Verrucomicrobiota bacterium]
MLVILPTFRRHEELALSVESVLRADVRKVENPRLCVVSNHPPSHGKVKSIIDAAAARCPEADRWQIDFVYRELTLPPAENWYGAITDNAHEEEIVFLHGDDDIMLPWGLEVRVRAMESHASEILTSPFVSGLLYDGEYCYPPAIAEKDDVRRVPELADVLGCAPFIGSSCFRYTEGFRMALKNAMQICEGQTWIAVDDRKLFLPFYIPLVAATLGVPVSGIDTSCVVRGTSLDEVIHAPFACRGWNNAYLYGAVHDLLSQQPLAAFPIAAHFSRQYLQGAMKGFFTVLADGRLTWPKRREWLQRFAGFIPRYPREVLGSCRLVVSESLRLRSIRVKVKLRSQRRCLSRDWFESLYKHQPAAS